MHEGPLTKTLVEAPETCRLTVLVCRRMVYVSVTPLKGEGGQAPLFAALPSDITAPSVAKAFQEVVYANPMLLLPFGAVTVLIDSRRYFWLPEEDAAHADEAAETMGYDIDSEVSCLAARADGINAAVMLTESALVNFVRRTFPEAEISHPAAKLVAYLSRAATQRARTWADLGPDALTVAVFDAAGLALCGSYHPTGVDSQTYYVVAATTTASLTPADTSLTISGPADARSELVASARRFVRTVVPAPLPQAAYLDGADTNNVPFSLLVSPLCE